MSSAGGALERREKRGQVKREIVRYWYGHGEKLSEKDEEEDQLRIAYLRHTLCCRCDSLEGSRVSMLTLTWLPSLCQKMAGWGFPVASHWKVTVLPTPTTWFLGRTTKAGGTGGQGAGRWLQC